MTTSRYSARLIDAEGHLGEQYTGSLEDVMTYVEDNTELHRGWTRQWISYLGTGYMLVRFNSKGREMTSHSGHPTGPTIKEK